MIDEKLKYISATDQEIELNNKAPYILLTIDGAGQAGIDTQTQKAAYQDGETYVDSLLDYRNINIDIIIKAGDKQELFNKRKELQKIFNPKNGPGKLIYTRAGEEKQIKAIVDDGPDFPSGENNRGITFQRSSITLLCPSPFWEDVMPGGEVLGFVSGGLTFPLKLNPVAPEHTIFSRRGFEAGLNNQGDVPTPVKITFFGEAENPKIKNNTTGEFIKINQTIGENEKLHINTAFGQKRAEIEDENGEITNAFHYLDLESTFWGLKVGSNDVDFESDISKDKASVEISFRNRYVGI